MATATFKYYNAAHCYFNSLDAVHVPNMAMIGSQFYIPGRVEPSEAGTAKEFQIRDDPLPTPFRPLSDQRSHEEAKSELENHRINLFNQLGKNISTKLHSVLKQLDSVADDGLHD